MKKVDQDPVCGMTVKQPADLTVEKGGKLFPFCSEACRRKFVESPEKYIDADEHGGSEASSGRGKSEGNSGEGVKQREEGRGASWKDYIPLIVIVGLTLLAAFAKQVALAGPWDGTIWMHDFMGFFLVVFSMFKFFNLEGFADGFQMYDLLAKPFRPYAYLYPFTNWASGWATSRCGSRRSFTSPPWSSCCSGRWACSARWPRVWTSSAPAWAPR